MRIRHFFCLSLFSLVFIQVSAQPVVQLQKSTRKVQLKMPELKTSPMVKSPGAREKCGFAYVMNQAAANGFKNEAFEKQLQQLIQNRAGMRTGDALYTVPVIFHIVHRGQAVGTTPNISAALVAAQIDQLNKDFANLAGSAYGVASDAGIRFCAAVVDPNGRLLPEAGIHRINGVDSGWSNTATLDLSGVVNYFNNTIKPRSIWDAYSYVNVWTANINASTLLGYATFPSPGSSMLNGLDYAETDSTAGTVIAASSVGSVLSPGSGTQYNLGRTLTHELGHFFGLRHIWGDAVCGNDYCADTPPQDNATAGCPPSPAAGNCTPAAPKMFENYMDYSNDACLNTFTANQKDRMQAIMQNSPRRIELATSGACQIRPANAVQFTLAKSAQTETGVTGICPLTKTITVAVSVAVQASGTATLTFTTGGTASYGADYTVSPASVSFTNGDAALKTVTITIIDDAAAEPAESIVLGYTITGTGVQASPEKQVFTVLLKDDDLERKVNSTDTTLVNQNFNGSTTLPLGWDVQNGFINGWAISANGGAGTTGNAAHITENAAARPNTYNEDEESEAYLRTPLIDATGLTDISLSFNWRCGGEAGFDEGYIGYALENDPATVTFFSTVFNGVTGTASGFTGTLPAAFNGTKFYLVFYWYNDLSLGDDPGFTIDDVVVTGQRTSVATTAGEAATAAQYAGQTAQYITTGNQIISRVAGLSQDVGCITAVVQSAGTGRTLVQTPTGSFFRTNKVVRITPATATTSAIYLATFYFTQAELSPTWSAAEIPALKILKVKEGVSLSGILTPTDAKVYTPVFVDNTAAGGYYAFTGNFSGGFSQFMLVSPAFTLPVDLLTFDAQAAKSKIILSWKTSSEKANKGFYIERSTNGIDFSKLAWVEGKGTATGASLYSYTDQLIQPNTVYYYRLKQVDVDNHLTLSIIRQAKIIADGVRVNVSPNPASNKLQVFATASTHPAHITLLNAKGQVVARWANAQLSSPYTIDVSRFAKGSYTLVIYLAEGPETKKILVE